MQLLKITTRWGYLKAKANTKKLQTEYLQGNEWWKFPILLHKRSTCENHAAENALICTFSIIFFIQGRFSKSLWLKDKLHWIFHVEVCESETCKNAPATSNCAWSSAWHVFASVGVIERAEKFSRLIAWARTRRCRCEHENLSLEHNQSRISEFFREIFYFLFHRSSSLIIQFERFNRHQHPAKNIFFRVISASCVGISVVTNGGVKQLQTAIADKEKSKVSFLQMHEWK
jgi:hypothetical protein